MASESIDTSVVPPTAVDLHEALWYATDRIRFAIGWGEVAALWLISVLGLFGIGLVYPPATTAAQNILYVGVVLLAFLGGYAMLEASRAMRALTDWENEMRPFMYAIKFEMLPFKGNSREEDIWERFVSVYPGLDQMSHPKGILPWTRRKNQVRFRAEVKGKKGLHFFHVFGRERDNDLFFVRRYEEDEPVTVDTLEKLKEDVEDVLRKVDISGFSVAAFAAGGYDEKAIAFAESDAGLVDEREPIDLFKETPNGYEVAFVSTD